MKNKFLLSLFCLFTTLAFSQSSNYAITGKVTDKDVEYYFSISTDEDIETDLITPALASREQRGTYWSERDRSRVVETNPELGTEPEEDISPYNEYVIGPHEDC